MGAFMLGRGYSATAVYYMQVISGAAHSLLLLLFLQETLPTDQREPFRGFRCAPNELSGLSLRPLPPHPTAWQESVCLHDAVPSRAQAVDALRLLRPGLLCGRREPERHRADVDQERVRDDSHSTFFACLPSC